ncbi:tetratricopeptide repeat protein [Methanobrevibacter wolinii]|uniref:tetratricopeptide repeat protein n=1 Tax=Methanobrevibacter wolinii TaxID=190977 RepID=UPI0005B2E011|nr:tetratricopeptide repeat protein [Methanobrevibacter wolinii]
MAEAKIKTKSKEIVEDFSFLYEDIVNPFVEYRQNLFKSLLGNLVGENKDLLKLFSFIDEGNYETALSYVDDLLNKDLNNLDSIDDENLLDLDSDLDNQNISMTVEEEVKISINKDLITDDNKNLLIFKSVILFNLNDEKDALDLINNLLDIDRKSFEIWSIRAIIQSSLGNYNNASRSFKKALKIDDGNTDLWILYVYSLLLNGNLDKALKENENALEAVPDNEEFNDNLNNILNNYEMNN